MPSNIEIKAKVNLQNAEKLAKTLTPEPPQHLHQVDTFFNLPKGGGGGRMKLRTESNNGTKKSVLITYFRSDAYGGPRESKYTLCPVPDAGKMLEVLGGALGIKGTVEKERTLYLIPWEKDPSLTARVHLDNVKHLGHYLEFEVVLPNDSEEGVKQGQLFAQELIEKFQIEPQDLEKVAYLDRLAEVLKMPMGKL